LLPLLRLGGLPHYGGDQRAEALTRIALDLHGEDLGGVHLQVQELNDAPQLGGNLVGNKDKSDLSRLEVRLSLLPENLGFHLRAKETGEFLFRVGAAALALGLKLGPQGLDGPIDNGVGGVVEHLPDDLASDARVAAALYLHEGRYGILIKE
jgi:hypothetical protein